MSPFLICKSQRTYNQGEQWALTNSEQYQLNPIQNDGLDYFCAEGQEPRNPCNALHNRRLTFLGTHCGYPSSCQAMERVFRPRSMETEFCRFAYIERDGEKSSWSRTRREWGTTGCGIGPVCIGRRSFVRRSISTWPQSRRRPPPPSAVGCGGGGVSIVCPILWLMPERRLS